MELNNTSAVVTGGASGLGEATARELSARGVQVVLADLNDAQGVKVAAEIGGAYVHCDVTNTEQVIETRTIGKDGEYSSAHDLELYRKVIEINLIGTFNVCRLAATAMGQNAPDVDNMRGAIVNTASVAAEDGQIGQVAYSSSKGGVVGLTLPLARDLAVIGVRANCILPGLIDTPIYGTGPQSDEFKARLGAGVLFPKRLGYSSEFATLAAEMLSNSYMNAESVRLDAGIRMQPK
jgi:NAD(P)-dependent dehydrogenase (short-subunit alcohol dehydrogenase family)